MTVNEFHTILRSARSRVRRGARNLLTLVAVLLLAVLAACVSIPPPPAVLPTAPPEMGSVAWKIQNAMSGGPMAIARNATILDWPAAKGADPVKLRAGTNGWVCRPDNPVTPTNDPRCLDPNYQKLFSVPHGPERVALNTLGIGYMLQGGDAADMFDITAMEPAPNADFVLDGPHTMINISGDFDPSLVTSDPSRGGP